MQIRALLQAAGGRELRVMLPMVTELDEIRRRASSSTGEVGTWRASPHDLPTSLKLGAMIEVPSLLWELDELVQAVDFVSVGSNDLVQFLTATDRGNTRWPTASTRCRCRSCACSKQIVDAGERDDVPVTMCGELAGRPIEAMALIGARLPLALDVAGLDRAGQGDADSSSPVGELAEFLEAILDRPRGRRRPHPRAAACLCRRQRRSRVSRTP